MDDRIDSRFEDSVKLICNKCGCICSTKNIDRIGARSIQPVWSNLGDHPIHYLALTRCNKLKHKIQDLRLLTDEEINKYKSEEELRKVNIILADQML